MNSTKQQEKKMQKFAIITSVQENYAAHNQDWDGEATYWKNKSGSTYLVYAENEAEARSVIDLVTSSSNAYIESKEDFFPIAEEFESEFVRNQKNYDPEGWETLYCDPVIKKGKSGDWYMKRGYIVGGFQKGTQYEHLVGKFYGHVDNLSKGNCVMRIEGDEKISLNKEAA